LAHLSVWRLALVCSYLLRHCDDVEGEGWDVLNWFNPGKLCFCGLVQIDAKRLKIDVMIYDLLKIVLIFIRNDSLNNSSPQCIFRYFQQVPEKPACFACLYWFYDR